MKRRELLVGTVSAAATASPTGAIAPAAARTGDKRTKRLISDTPTDREISDMVLIQNLLAGSAISADTGSSAFQSALYAEDAVMDVGGSVGEIRGRDAIVGVITDASHSRLRTEGLAHLAAPPYVQVAGSRAVAVGYLQIMAQDSSASESAPVGIPSTGRWVTWRLTANRWDFELREGRWQITRRTIRPAPSAEALDLLRMG